MKARNLQPDEAAEAQRMLYSGTWDAQPRWAKVLTIAVGVPAWIVFLASVIRGDVHRVGWLMYLCFGAVGAVTLLQAFFVARAYWRMEL